MWPIYLYTCFYFLCFMCIVKIRQQYCVLQICRCTVCICVWLMFFLCQDFPSHLIFYEPLKQQRDLPSLPITIKCCLDSGLSLCVGLGMTSCACGCMFASLIYPIQRPTTWSSDWGVIELKRWGKRATRLDANTKQEIMHKLFGQSFDFNPSVSFSLWISK